MADPAHDLAGPDIVVGSAPGRDAPSSLLPTARSADTDNTEVRTMLGVLMTLVAAVVVVGVGCGLALAVREHGRRQPDPAWKPTGYRVR